MTAADLYEVQSYYQRFDQKNNVTRQRLWNPQVIDLWRNLRENLEKKILKSLPGYDLRDWAFYVGASSNLTASGSSINWPNRRGNSWQPLAELSKSSEMISPNQNYGKLDAEPSVAASLVRKIGYLFGADQVGICLLDRRWVYSDWFDEDKMEHYPIKFSDEPGYEKYQEPTQLEDRTHVIPSNMKYTIVLIHEMDELGIATAPTMTQQATTMTTYSRISLTTTTLAEFIRALGYNAIPSINDTALNIPMAIDAGLGELGRNGKLINSKYGPRCRISKVITDLPLKLDKPKLLGVTEFCNVCRKCADHCPAGAIPFGERSFKPIDISNNGGVLIWQLNHIRCFEHWSKVGTNCGICIRVCPFNKSKLWLHNMVRAVVRVKSSAVDSILAKMDDILGYGRFQNPDRFWSE